MNLEGKLVRFRAYNKEDIPVVYEYINDPEVKRFLMPGIPFPMRIEEEYKWFDSQTAFGDTYNFAIEILKEGKYAGGCGINSIDWKNRYATVGIFLGRPYWGKGYGTDAMKVLLKFIFEEMNLNKIILITYSFNERAIACYQKVGFKIEGILREQIFRDGCYYDEIAMGILFSEWKERQK